MGVTDVMPVSTSEVEVMAKPTRRRFTAEYKLRVLREAEGCSRPGKIGADKFHLPLLSRLFKFGGPLIITALLSMLMHEADRNQRSPF